MLQLDGVKLAEASPFLGGSTIRIDFGGLNFIDVCGLGALVEAKKRKLHGRDRRPNLCSPAGSLTSRG
jgi:anti-anti-sigma regulatory factor